MDKSFAEVVSMILLREWQERNPDADARKIIDAFIRKRCPDWAKMLIGGLRGAYQ